nr:polysaccharide biosynthesis tyrosine autokinase [Mycolicibacterium komanii]CRL69237.1 chain length determinant protein [Mycolicibacterium komanii]
MTFRNLVRILGTRWKLAATAVLACLIGAAFITVVQTRVYEASTTVLISFSGASDLNELYNGTLTSQERLSSYAEIAGGRSVVERAVSQLQLPVDVDDVLSQTKVDFTLDSMLLRISVKDTDPERAAALVGAITEQFGAIVPTLGVNSLPSVATDRREDVPPPQSQPQGDRSPQGRATIVEPPRVPVEPVSPVPMRNMAIGLVAGLLLGIAVAVIRENSDRTVRDRDGLERLSGLPVLSELPGKRGRAPKFGVDADFDDSVRGLAVRLRRRVGPDGCQILVTGPVGGEGATTTAVHLSLVLAEIGEDVLVVEGDSRRSEIAGMLHVESGTGLAEVLADVGSATEAVTPTAVSRLYVLASSSHSSSTALSGTYPAEAIENLLTDMSSRFDRVVVDGPPVLATVDTALLAGATRATLLVVRAGHTRVDDVRDAVDSLRAANSEVVGLVLTGARPKMRNRVAAQNYRASASGQA